MGMPVPAGDRHQAGADVEPEARAPQQTKHAARQGLLGWGLALRVGAELHHQQGQPQPEQWNHLDQASTGEAHPAQGQGPGQASLTPEAQALQGPCGTKQQ